MPILGAMVGNGDMVGPCFVSLLSSCTCMHRDDDKGHFGKLKNPTVSY